VPGHAVHHAAQGFNSKVEVVDDGDAHGVKSVANGENRRSVAKIPELEQKEAKFRAKNLAHELAEEGIGS
jgi:hypothetical protein